MERKSSAKLILFLLLFCTWLYVPFDYGGGSSVTNLVMDGLGFHDFRDIDRLFITTFVVLYCIVFTYVADMLLGKASFGLPLTYLGAILAIAATLWYYSNGYGKFSAKDAGLISFLVLLPPFAVLAALAIVRKTMTFIVNLAMASGRTKMKVPSARETAQNGPTADRLRIATRTRR